MRTDDLDFDLPAELIAQEPAAERSASRLLCYRRQDGSVRHQQFAELPRLLRRGDLLVFNDTQVVPARFALRKRTGGVVEGLYLQTLADGRWLVMLRNAGRAAVGQSLQMLGATEVEAQVVEKRQGGQYVLAVPSAVSAMGLLARVGRMPLPPYIKRQRLADQRDELDRQRYQTVYARQAGAVAAPTAGLHFTPQLLEQLDETGIARTTITLHVGLGTFKPVEAPTLAEHAMHSEHYQITAQAAEALNRANDQGQRIVAVGTTVARVLESQPRRFAPVEGATDIFIYPPYQWRHVRALITNFHLPRSTLIALVVALVGLEEQRRIYQLAIEQRYRFFSYGDAMLME